MAKPIPDQRHHALGNRLALRPNDFAACRSDYVALLDCFAYFLLDGSLSPVDCRRLRERS